MSAPSPARALISLSLSFRPLAQQIGSLRGALSDLYAPYLAPDQLSRVLLAAHELLENIVKYSTGDFAELHAALEPQGSTYRVRLRTKNRTHESRLADARQRLDALNAAPDPVLHYDELIRASAGRRDVSGLGLARIPAESDMRLLYAIEHDWLTLTAETDALPRGAA